MTQIESFLKFFSKPVKCVNCPAILNYSYVSTDLKTRCPKCQFAFDNKNSNLKRKNKEQN